MSPIDGLVCALYLLLSLALGFYLSRQGSKSMEDFFVSGRSLPWWLAGTSMAATTFSIDTPLYVAGVVGNRGIAGNWEWWNFAIAHVVMIYIFSRLWRRSQVLTDAELTELRYGGRVAAILRGVKAFLFAVPINCIGIGYAMTAAVKVADGLGIWQSIGMDADAASSKMWGAIAIGVFVLLYTSVSGLWGVVATDFFQFFLGLFGALVVAIFAISSVGGVRELVSAASQISERDMLSFVPLQWGAGGLSWNDAAGITASTFAAYLFLQWWSFRRSDGGGEFVQRLIATKDEAEAEKAAWFFNVLNYIVRTWPWILVALAAVVLYPDLSDRELGYPKLMLDFLPSGLLGLAVASLLAAFMSTVSTSINWGASYLTNDLYLRFIRSEASQAELVWVGRLSSVLVTGLGSVAAFYAKDVATIFRLVIAIGTGPGLVLVLRWFWWRINAAAELTAMVAGFGFGLLFSLPADLLPVFAGIRSSVATISSDFGTKLFAISLTTAVLWLAAMFLTPPESAETLDRFYRRVRPAGFWKQQQERTGLQPVQRLDVDIYKSVASILLLFGTMFAIGGFLLLQSRTGWVSLAIAVAGGFWLRSLYKMGARARSN